MPNPYRIDTTAAMRPIQQATADLRGLTGAINQQQSEKQKQQRFMEAFQAKDADSMAAFVAEYPEMQNQMTAAIKHKNKMTEDSRLATQSKILTDPDNAVNYLDQHISTIEAQGGDASDSKRMKERFLAGDETVLKDTELGFAMLAPKDMWANYKESKSPDYKGRALDIQERELESREGLKNRELSLKERGLALEGKKLEQALKKGMDPKEMTTEERFKHEKNLRGEVSAITKSFRDGNDAFGRIAASVSDPSAAGDMALIFNYMKMLDPGSTVREGEFATAEQARGVSSHVLGLYNRITKGQRLTDAQRDDFFDRANKLYSQSAKNYRKRTGEYVALAEKMNLDPDNVVLQQQLFGADEPGSPAQPTEAPPAEMPTTNEQGWQLMQDAAGNKAYVGPNGEVQEVQ